MAVRRLFGSRENYELEFYESITPRYINMVTICFMYIFSDRLHPLRGIIKISFKQKGYHNDK